MSVFLFQKLVVALLVKKYWVTWTVISDVFTPTLKMEAAGSSEKLLPNGQNALRRMSDDLDQMSLFCRLCGHLYRIVL